MIAEIEEIHRRLSLALQERTDYLKNSVSKYLTTEMKNLKELKSNLDLELANIQVLMISQFFKLDNYHKILDIYW